MRIHCTLMIETMGQELGCKTLTPFRCAGLATFSFFVT